MTTLLLFDIDGTLTEPMQRIDPATVRLLREVKATGRFSLGVVGGSDRPKAEGQLTREVLDEIMDVAFHENGAVMYVKGQCAARQRLEDAWPADELNRLIVYLLRELADLPDVPTRTGTFIERRTSVLNISPVGRNASVSQRHAFAEWDRKTGCRQALRDKILRDWAHLDLDVVCGGEISLDLFPRGLDKTCCLRHVQADRIVFFGDRMDPGGNDYALARHPRVTPVAVRGPSDTYVHLKGLIGHP